MPLTPTPGADASAAGFTLVPGTGLAADIEEYINRALDEVAVKVFLKTGAALGIALGGTGATTAAAARSNLGLGTAAEQNAVSYVTNQQSPQGIGINWTGSRFSAQIGATVMGLLNEGDIPGIRADRVAKAGDTMTGDLYVPNSTAANSGFTIAYINGDGRLCRGSSSERYKKYITEVDVDSMGELFPGVYRYKMRSGTSDSTPDTRWHYGWIAERLAANPDTEPFVVYGDDGEPESIDFIGLLILQVSCLHRRLSTVEGRMPA